jgi:aromatic ring-opening dioxygenase catalytic subunit (LigB family)
MTMQGSGVIFAAAMSHAPHIGAFPELAEPSQREAIYSAMNELGRQLLAADPDVLVLVSSDHFTNLPPGGSTQFLIGSDSAFRGPVEDWIGIEQREVKGSMRDAAEIFNEISHVASQVRAAPIRLEHGVMTPLRWLDPDGFLPLVPILQNCITPPLPTLADCYSVGEALARVATRTGRRFAVVGTGGLSHSPGAPEAGRIDEGFDRDFLHMLRHAQVGQILDLPDDRVDRAGFGAWEIRQWVTALGASSGAPAKVLAYEPVVPWETGCGVARFVLGTAAKPGAGAVAERRTEGCG